MFRTTRRTRKYPVNSVNEKLTPEINAIVTKLRHATDYKIEGTLTGKHGLPITGTFLRVYAVDQLRGRAYYNKGEKRVITVPVWVFKRGPDYVMWYCAHELAHHYSHHYDNEAGHGAKFMKWLKIICPENSIHHELGYKPRNAAAAGIRAPKSA